MRQFVGYAAVAACLLVGACASEPDHFYTLTILPEGARTGLASPTVHVLLSVDLPALVDRPEMVVGTSANGVAVLEHQRWAAPLSDQLLQTLARDIERRRHEVLVADRGFDGGATPPVKVQVDILSLSVQPAGGHIVMETRWRIVDASSGVDLIADQVFDSPVNGIGYASVANGYSQVMSSLADKLAAAIPAPGP